MEIHEVIQRFKEARKVSPLTLISPPSQDETPDQKNTRLERLLLLHKYANNADKQRFYETVMALEPNAPDYFLLTAVAYQYGTSVTAECKEKAREYYTQLLEKEPKNYFVMINLALMYLVGSGGDKNIEKTLEWVEEAAHAGNTRAMVILAEMYQQGIGCEQSLIKSREWYAKAAAAGNALAMNNLGSMYEHGKGGDQNETLARDWYTRSAAAGNTYAMRNLAYMYEQEKDSEQAHRKARVLYRHAALAGDSNAMSNLALMYEQGKGGAKNDKKARKWYKKAAVAGGEAWVMNHLATMYEQGIGGDIKINNAYEWFKKSADKGFTAAMVNLANLCKNQGKIRDALMWYHIAADKGEVSAWDNLTNIAAAGNSQALGILAALQEVYQDVSTALELGQLVDNMGKRCASIIFKSPIVIKILATGLLKGTEAFLPLAVLKENKRAIKYYFIDQLKEAASESLSSPTAANNIKRILSKAVFTAASQLGLQLSFGNSPEPNFDNTVDNNIELLITWMSTGTGLLKRFGPPQTISDLAQAIGWKVNSSDKTQNIFKNVFKSSPERDDDQNELNFDRNSFPLHEL